MSVILDYKSVPFVRYGKKLNEVLLMTSPVATNSDGAAFVSMVGCDPSLRLTGVWSQGVGIVLVF